VAWRIEYLRSAQKSVDRLDPKVRARIRDYLRNRVASLDNPRTMAKPLKGPLLTYWRFRVGDWGIICDIQDDRLVVLVISIGHRNDVYQ
jgi:mRNA interferase RelE/StbE